MDGSIILFICDKFVIEGRKHVTSNNVVRYNNNINELTDPEMFMDDLHNIENETYAHVGDKVCICSLFHCVCEKYFLRTFPYDSRRILHALVFSCKILWPGSIPQPENTKTPLE